MRVLLVTMGIATIFAAASAHAYNWSKINEKSADMAMSARWQLVSTGYAISDSQREILTFWKGVDGTGITKCITTLNEELVELADICWRTDY